MDGFIRGAGLEPGRNEKPRRMHLPGFWELGSICHG